MSKFLNNQTTEVLGVRIDLLNFEEILEFILQEIKAKEKAKVYTINNEFIVEAQKNEKFRDVLNNSDLNIIDSTGVKWAIKKLKKIDVVKTPGADVFNKIVESASQNGWRVFLLGGRKSAASKSAQILKMKFPKLEIDFLDNIKIDPDKSNEDISKKINDFRSDIVFVALGAPKQEKWIENNYKSVSGSVFMGIGGTLDFISGNLKRAPKFIRQLGLEWLYRLIQEPRRAGRIYRATVVFPKIVCKSQKDILSGSKNP